MKKTAQGSQTLQKGLAPIVAVLIIAAILVMVVYLLYSQGILKLPSAKKPQEATFNIKTQKYQNPFRSNTQQSKYINPFNNLK